MTLDTNAYTALKQGDSQIMEIIRQADRIALPLTVVAELKYGFLKGSRTDQNQKMLDRYMALPFVTILLPTLGTCDIYAELELYARRQGRALSNNDIWIAALAREAGDTLVTYDQDFQVFRELMGDNITILERS